jgi:hypothetical protein
MMWAMEGGGLVHGRNWRRALVGVASTDDCGAKSVHHDGLGSGARRPESLRKLAVESTMWTGCMVAAANNQSRRPARLHRRCCSLNSARLPHELFRIGRMSMASGTMAVIDGGVDPGIVVSMLQHRRQSLSYMIPWFRHS